jgi:L-iditol 2-dehydrogenase
VIAIGKRKSQMDIARRLGAAAAFDVTEVENPVSAVRQLTEGARGADAVIEAVGRAQTWEWALQIVRKGGTVNLFGGCPSGTEVKIDPAALHYAEITIKSTFHHTPQFIREALETIARGEIRASDFVTGEVHLEELPQVFLDMKNRNGELKTAVIP